MPFELVNFEITPKQKVALFLSRKLSFTHPQVQRLFDSNRVYCNGILTKDKKTICEGTIGVELFIPHTKECQPIFTTKDFLVFDKPPLLHIHPQVNYHGYTLLDEIRHYGGKDANPAHRLDRETSGLVIAAKNADTTKALKSLFEHRNIKKIYRALVCGKIDKVMTIDAPIANNSDDNTSKHKVKIVPHGKPSTTLVKPLFYNSDNDTTLVELEPLTGRTHQLRIHLFHVKHPIVGDPLYGANYDLADRYLDGLLSQEERIKQLKSPRLMLHAYCLEFGLVQKYKIFSQCSTWNNHSWSKSIIS